MTPIAPLGTPDTPRAAPLAAAAAMPAIEARPTATPAFVPNPALRMDPELGLVVLEFRDAKGEVAASIPTDRELDAYRQAARVRAPRTEDSAAPPRPAGPPSAPAPVGPGVPAPAPAR